jgi:hypothetical protein
MFNIICAGLTFVGVAGLFHLWLFTLGRNASQRFWKATDYCWLTVALIGLWGLSEQHEKTAHSQRIQEAQARLETEYAAQQARVISFINTQNAIALNRIAERSVISESDKVWLKSLVMSNSELNVLLQAISFKRPHKNYAYEIKRIVSTFSNAASNAFAVDGAEKMLSRSIHIEEELARLRFEAASTRYSANWGLIAPILLAIALALRFTRVAAEVFVLDRGPPSSRVRPTASLKRNDDDGARLNGPSSPS